METQLQAAKVALRKQIRERLRRHWPTARVDGSRELCASLRQVSAWLSAKSVMCFAPLPDEVDIWPLVEEALANGKAVALPRFSVVTQGYVAAIVRDPGADLGEGRFGIREPRAECPEFPLGRLDLVLVPGVAFDACGHRLGRGHGFYDRLLGEVRGVKCGVAFDEQVLAEVPAGCEDVRVNCIVTPTRWLEC